MGQNSIKKGPDLQLFIGTLLRWGVSIACTVGLIGGIYYLIAHGGDVMPDYSSFHSEAASYTTWEGIWHGVLNFQAKEWIQFGVVLLIFTPIFRVAFSLFTFAWERDWMYVLITAVVLGIILGNMWEGVGH